MFIQIIQGPVADAGALLRQWDDLALGTVAGITAAGDFVGVACFASEEAARQQGQWWATMQACFGGPVTVLESDDTEIVMGGCVAGAGFVQVMQAKVRDRARFDVVDAELVPVFAELRPDFLGSLRIWRPGDALTVVDSFSSEAEARAGEKKPFPSDSQALFDTWLGLVEDVHWYDLTEPWWPKQQ